jgi:CDP-glucose 4,6-dehydratase
MDSKKRYAKNGGEGISYRLDRGKHPHEAHYLKLNCKKAKSRLKWHPKWGLETAIDKIVEWTRDYRAGIDVRETCIRQIKEYEKK